MLLSQSILALCAAAAVALALVKCAGLLQKQMREQRPAALLLLAMALAIRNFASGKPVDTNTVYSVDSSQHVIYYGGAIGGGGASGPQSPVHLSHPPKLDSDNDGIPDDWERWTHSNRFADDSAVDLDGDGLTTLEEFCHQTDHRVADTDSDGFTDGREVANGMDPLAKEDFTHVELDADKNGIIDAWQTGQGYPPPRHLYGFVDANSDGWDDRYAQHYMPPASTDNFDIEITVESSRSVALSFSTNGVFEGIVLTAPGATALKLRLEHGENHPIKVLPHLPDTPPPTNGLWRARMFAKFLPRPEHGQTATGNALVAEHGPIAYARVVKRDMFKKFSPPEQAPQQAPASGQFPTRTEQGAAAAIPMRSGSGGDGGGENGPSINIDDIKFHVRTDERGYHNPDFAVGDFWIESGCESDYLLENISWSCEYGRMTPGEGMRSHLTVTKIPQTDDKRIPVVAEVKLDKDTYIKKTHLVNPCLKRNFAIEAGDGFSPHLGESLPVGVTLPGCSHDESAPFASGKRRMLQIEVKRETAGGWQSIAFFDMDAASPGIQKQRDTTALAQTGASWNGRAQVDLPAADHPEIFDKVKDKQPFNRAMQRVVSDLAVPPPFCTIVARLFEEGDIANAVEIKKTVCIPQIVKVILTKEAKVAFMQPMIEEAKPGIPVTLYAGCSSDEANILFSGIVPQMAALVPSGVNLRIVEDGAELFGLHKTLRFLSGERSSPNGMSNINPRNETDVMIGQVYVNGFANSLIRHHSYTIPTGSAYSPIQSGALAIYLAVAGIHEIGHVLGLVDFLYLSGDTQCHNLPDTGVHIMGPHAILRVEDFPKKGEPATKYWLDENVKYLKFILPTTHNEN